MSSNFINKIIPEGKRITISVALSGDTEIRKLNKKYLKRDCTTDVLSFNINQETPEGNFHLGDIIVNIEQAKKQAEGYDNTFEEEIAELVAHGVLHLLGVHHPHDDEESVHDVKVKNDKIIK